MGTASPPRRTPIRPHHLELLPGDLLVEVDVALGQLAHQLLGGDGEHLQQQGTRGEVGRGARGRSGECIVMAATLGGRQAAGHPPPPHPCTGRTRI